MDKIVRISSHTPLSLEKIADTKHWQTCYEGFGKGLAILGAEGELEALQVLIAEHCRGGMTRGFADRLLWVYCLHVDSRLAELALRSLSPTHSETIGFEWLSEVRRRNFIRLLIERLAEPNMERSRHFIQLVVSIANRGLGSESEGEMVLAGALLSSTSLPPEVVKWLPLESPKARKWRAMSVCFKGERFLGKPLRVHLLHQILVCEPLDVAVIAEKALACLYHLDGDYSYQYSEPSEVKSMFSHMLCETPDRKEKSYVVVMQWRGYQVDSCLTDTRKAVRSEVEKFLKNTPPADIREFMNMELFSLSGEQFDRTGLPIEYSLTRAQIHASYYPMAIDHVDFYRKYRDEELGEKMVSFLNEICSETYLRTFGLESLDRAWVDEVVIEMLECFPFNVRRRLAESRLQCDMYFHHFLQPGLPLHSLDAIKYVDWDRYQELASPEDVEKAISYLARISRLNLSMQDNFREKFGIEPQVLD